MAVEVISKLFSKQQVIIDTTFEKENWLRSGEYTALDVGVSVEAVHISKLQYGGGGLGGKNVPKEGKVHASARRWKSA